MVELRSVSSWVVVAGGLTGVDFIPMKFCGEPSCLALGVAALSGCVRYAF